MRHARAGAVEGPNEGTECSALRAAGPPAVARAATFLALLALAPAPGCACGRTGLRVDVRGFDPGDFQELRVQVINGGAPLLLTVGAEPDRPMRVPVSVGVALTSPVPGPARVCAAAYRDAALLAAGCADATVRLGAVDRVVVLLEAVAGRCECPGGDCQCQGEYLAGETCVSRGYVGGTLGCAANCTFDIANCETCGNGVADTEADEQCDGADLGGRDCTTEGFASGALACVPGDASGGPSFGCTVDTTGCSMCGNDVLEAGEQCDGPALGGTCADLGYDGGTIGCLVLGGPTCIFDTTGCYACGDLVADTADGEQCDTEDLGGTTCRDLGFYGGVLLCTAGNPPDGCQFDTSACTNCGDGAIDAGEDCDGADLGSATCVSRGLASGTLACRGDCTFDLSSCTFCGNRALDVGEECDIDWDRSCTDLGFGGGPSLPCPIGGPTGGCLYDELAVAACAAWPPPGCGDSDCDAMAGEDCRNCALDCGTCCGDTVCQAFETCASCPGDCGACCGNGVADPGEDVADPGEDCDPGNPFILGDEDLRAFACETMPASPPGAPAPYSWGFLTCNVDCTFYTLWCVTCGNGVLDAGEQCDGTDWPESATCRTAFGAPGGALSCLSTCVFGSAGCTQSGP